jgi:hypothetical protein
MTIRVKDQDTFFIKIGLTENHLKSVKKSWIFNWNIHLFFIFGIHNKYVKLQYLQPARKEIIQFQSGEGKCNTSIMFN